MEHQHRQTFPAADRHVAAATTHPQPTEHQRAAESRAEREQQLQEQLNHVVRFAKAQEEELKRMQEEVLALRKELGTVKGLLRKSQQRAAMLLERLSVAVLGSSGGGGGGGRMD